MKRRGFTMVELIFVIVIIGILATMAMPKFGDTTKRAKINSELAGMESLEAAMKGAIEFHMEDYGDAKVNWHNYADMNDTSNATVRSKHYKNINDSRKVLQKITKKNDKLKITGWALIDGRGNWSYADGLYYDILMIEGEASNSENGVTPPKDAPGQDFKGKPDRNDFWVFNPSSIDITVVGRDANTPINPTVVEAGSMVLIDVNGTKPVSPGNVRFSGPINGNGDPKQFYFIAPAK